MLRSAWGVVIVVGMVVGPFQSSRLACICVTDLYYSRYRAPLLQKILLERDDETS